MVIYRRLKQDGAGAGFDTHCLYAHRLRRTPDGWKITGVKQQVLWNTGDPLIHAGAKTKATTG